MKSKIKKSYEITVSRGLISKNTTMQEFIDKLKEEYSELLIEWGKGVFVEDISDPFWMEMMDIVGVCFNCMQHHNIDIDQLFDMMNNKNQKKMRSHECQTP